MGIYTIDLDMVQKALAFMAMDEAKASMCEFGNQRLSVARGIPYKQLFKGRHVSIDLNGRDGALVHDLTKPCTTWQDIKPGTFDLVTNFGTNEHCHDQRAVFENMHMLCRVGGVMLHGLPSVGSWPGHGQFLYTDEFLRVLLRVNGYAWVAPIRHTGAPGLVVIHGAFSKLMDVPFRFDIPSDCYVQDITCQRNGNNVILK